MSATPCLPCIQGAHSQCEQGGCVCLCVKPDALSLHARIAKALGSWTEEQAKTFSLHALRDLVRPVSPKLAHEITLAIEKGP